jgi:hypothetical protein
MTWSAAQESSSLLEVGPSGRVVRLSAGHLVPEELWSSHSAGRL